MRFSGAATAAEGETMDSAAPSPDPHTGVARTRRLALCAGCCESFGEEHLRTVAGADLCARCATRVQNAATRPAPARDRRKSSALAASTLGASTDIDSGGLLVQRREDMRAWCSEVAWLPRLPVLVLVAYWAIRHVGDTQYSSVIDGLNFGIHELGHVVFTTFGEFTAIAGGSLLQCAAPLIAAVMFIRQRDYFAVSFALGWFATNLYDVAVYVADARSQSLQLVGLGAGEPIHDWNYLLGQLGLLNSDQVLAASLRGCGVLAFATSLALGGWLLACMFRASRSSS